MKRGYEMLTLKIKKYRKANGLSQKDLSQMSKVSQEYICDLEKIDRRKSPSLFIMCMIGRALKICPFDLIECTGKNNICKYCYKIKMDD